MGVGFWESVKGERFGVLETVGVREREKMESLEGGREGGGTETRNKARRWEKRVSSLDSGIGLKEGLLFIRASLS